MNYLSHQFIARRVHPEKNAPALFFAGNLLPDLLAISGDGRFRSAGNHTGDLAEGVRLHLATDKHFHGSAAFRLAQEGVKNLLASAAWDVPPKRTFFLTHVITELVLDAMILSRTPHLVEDLYDTLSKSLRSGLVGEAEAIQERPVPNLQSTVERFIHHPFLRDYASPEGLAKSMVRVSLRAGIANFETVSDQQRLASIFTDFAPHLAPYFDDLLSVPLVPPESRMIQ